MEIKTKVLPRISFKEVHKSLEKESDFLLNNDHNFDDFAKKGDFLKSIGFGNSIAAEIYSGISSNKEVLNKYKSNYPQNNFILEPQLKRLCEKYNLFVRRPVFFMGDIPEKNIKDMMNFKVRLDDLVDLYSHFRKAGSHNLYNTRDFEMYNSEVLEVHDRWNTSIDNDFNPKYYTVKLNDLYKLKMSNRHFLFADNRNVKIPLIEIAAVEDLFNKKAFEQSTARILTSAQLDPIAQVDTDPIVMIKTLHGRLIITAWGDEANDELVLPVGQN